jgi:hypothetical protein
VHKAAAILACGLVLSTQKSLYITRGNPRCTCVLVYASERCWAAGKVLTAEMKKADLDSDGRISLQEFLRYYGTMAKLQTTYEREGRIRAYHQPQAVPPGAAPTTRQR